MESQFDVSILIPFLNEEDGILELINKIEEYHQIREFNFEIIFINDGSTDSSNFKIKNKNILFPCKLISLSKNFGPHSAVRAGIVYSKSKFITCLPADLQISFDILEKMYIEMIGNYDMVFAIREQKENEFFENIFSRIHSFLVRKFIAKDYPLSGLETFMINEKVQSILNANIESNSSLFLQIFTLGFKKKLISFEKKVRKNGKSKWTTSKKIKLLIDSFLSFSFMPIRLVSLVGIIFFMVGLIWTSYTIYHKFMYDDLVSGWPALLSILLIGFGITNISLGIIAEYLWRTLDSSRKRPVFIIEDIVSL